MCDCNLKVRRYFYWCFLFGYVISAIIWIYIGWHLAGGIGAAMGYAFVNISGWLCRIWMAIRGFDWSPLEKRL